MKKTQEQFNQKPEPYEIPEDIQRNELEVYDRLPDREFWTEKNLEYWFARDSAFGAKLVAGLTEILGGKLEEDAPEYEEFNRLADSMQIQLSTTPEKARAAMYARKWVSKTFDIPLEQLTARNIATRAYMSEAEAMRDVGFDSDGQPPFSFGSGLKVSKEHRDVKRVLREDRGGTEAKINSDLADTTTETFAAASPSESERAKLVNEFQKSPGLFENYIRWLDDVASAIGGKKHPKEILNMLYSLRLAERNKSLNAKDILAMQVFCIRQMKKNLREHGFAGDILTKEAFQKWSRSKKIPGTGDR